MVERVALTEKEAANYIGLAVGTLQKTRILGVVGGRMAPPPFVRLGRYIRYLKRDLDRWLEDHRVEFNRPDFERGGL